MKKLVIIAALVMVGVGFAYASSLSVPWFVDSKTVTSAGLPPTLKGVIGLIYLHNNSADPTTCAITYYSENGDAMGPDASANTFTIIGNATISFRPVATDPNSAPGGQESAASLLVPNRPLTTAIGGASGNKGNGSAVISWLGSSGIVQGIYVQCQNVDGGATGRVIEFGTLLPPGI
jgi:hypothetical protein